MRILAHRARQGTKHPENSLAALRDVLKRRVDGVEIDVRRGADGEYFIHHDPAFADGTPVESLKASALKKRKLSNGEPIPTLEDFLRAADRGLVFLDLKETCDAVEVAERALRVLPKERLFFSSFWHPGILELGHRRPELRRGITLEARLVDPADALRRANANVLVLPGSCADVSTVAHVHLAGGEVWCWAVQDAKALEEIGVSCLITD